MDLHELGWNDRLAALAADHSTENLARVVRVDRGRVTLAGPGGLLRARDDGRPTPGGAEPPAVVGDWVTFDDRETTAVVVSILPRTGVLVRRRPGPGRAAQPVAANVDLVLAVGALDRGPNPRRIERAAALAWDAGATPVVVLTKADLCDDVDGAARTASGAAPFVDVIPVDARHEDGVEAVRRLLTPGRTAVLLGPSGAGKSTLANRLLGTDRLATGAVRAGDAKGRHTTTHRELVTVPSGGCLVDTPGVRELGLWLDAGAVDAAFDDVVEIATGCRFADCRHEDEPGCAVRAAAGDGRLDPDRLDGYLRMRREAEALDLRSDPARRAEARRRDRVFAKIVRAEVQRKRRG